MPWEHCGHPVADDAACETCGLTKAQWTVTFEVTRQFKVTAKRYVRLTLLAAGDRPVPDEPYAVSLPGGAVVEGALDAEGNARVAWSGTGTGEVRFPRRTAADVVRLADDEEGAAETRPAGDAGAPARFECAAGRRLRARLRLANAAWDRAEARVGTEVGLRVDAALDEGAEVTFRIREHDADGADDDVATVSGRVEGGVATARWTFAEVDDSDDVATADEVEGGYTAPEFVFEASEPGGARDASGVLQFQHWFELKVRDHDGELAADVEVTLTLADGSTRTATTDANGRARWENVPPGSVRYSFERAAAAAEHDHPGYRP